jgi:RNA polymerase sigma-70 factor (ECF subfamily)
MNTTATQPQSSIIDSLVTDLFDRSLGFQTTTVIDESAHDLDIIKSVVRGCRENYSLLVDRYYNPIFNYLLRSVNFHNETSEDLVSETFFKAYLNLNRYNNRAKFSSWLYKIAHNTLIDYYRAFKQTHVEIDTISADSSNRELVQKLTSDALDMQVVSHDLLQPVLDALETDDRQLLILFYIEELSIQEIASVYNVFPGTIKTRLHRARTKAKSIILQHTDNQEGNFIERVESFMYNISTVVFNNKPTEPAIRNNKNISH